MSTNLATQIGLAAPETGDDGEALTPSVMRPAMACEGEGEVEGRASWLG